MKFKPIIGTDLSGHIGGVVASHNAYGPYFRQRVRPVNRRTQAQQDQRGAMATTARQWRALDPGVQAAWDAATVTKTSRKGDRVILSGNAAYQFCNTLRNRAGLSPVTSPPSSDTAPAISPPTAVLTSSTTIDLTFSGNDAWNTAQGAVVISASLICSPGQKYKPANRACAILSNTEGVVSHVTLPFAVPIGATVRLEMHAVDPDGRMTQYVTLDRTNAAFPPPSGAPRYVLSVTAIGTKKFLWRFNDTITVVAGPDPALRVDDDSSGVAAQGGIDGAILTYSTANGSPKTWEMLADPNVINEPCVTPESGTTD
jgi:hypothetical protein